MQSDLEIVRTSEKILATPLQTVLNTKKNPYSFNQATQNILANIFLPKKIPKSKISNPKRSFHHPRHMKCGVHPWAARDAKEVSVSGAGCLRKCEKIQSLCLSCEKWGFVKAAFSRTVRLRECPLGDLQLYWLNF